VNLDVPVRPTPRTPSNFFIPDESNYIELLDLILVVAHGTAETVAAANQLSPTTELASHSLNALAFIFEKITELRKKNWVSFQFSSPFFWKVFTFLLISV
jgi:hypothetical protein